MNDCPMSDMGAFFQQNSCSRKHVKGAIFLHIATIFNDNFAPVAT